MKCRECVGCDKKPGYCSLWQIISEWTSVLKEAVLHCVALPRVTGSAQCWKCIRICHGI